MERPARTEHEAGAGPGSAPAEGPGALTIWSIGHSTLAIEEFLARLAGHGIEHVADVRSFPGSRKHPQFSSEALAAALARARIGYSHHRDLGGFRRPRPDSRNRLWRHESFRGYADHMETPAFQAALEEVVARARGMRVAILCAEADPFRCHRRLIADALHARGIEVLHIRTATRAEPHRLTPGARASGGRVEYPAPDLLEGADPGAG